MEGYVDTIPLIHSESHRWWCICPHEAVSTEDGEADMHDEIFVGIAEWRYTFNRWDTAESVDRSFELSSENWLIKEKRFFGLCREVQVGGSRGHKKKIKDKIISQKFQWEFLHLHYCSRYMYVLQGRVSTSRYHSLHSRDKRSYSQFHQTDGDGVVW